MLPRRQSMGRAYSNPVPPLQVPAATSMRESLHYHGMMQSQGFSGPSNGSAGVAKPRNPTNCLPSMTGSSVPANLFSMYASQSSALMQPPLKSSNAISSAQKVSPFTEIPSPNMSLTSNDPEELALDDEPITYHSAPMIRDDSGIGHPSITSYGGNAIITPFKSGYEQMRRSFSACAELTPPVSTDMKASDTDPKKRSHPVSSPILSNKRVRLSFPEGQSAAGINDSQVPNEQSGSVSSPVKFPSLTVPHTTSSPAPMFAPAAVMYVPAEQDEGVQAGANVSAELPEAVDGDDTPLTGPADPSSDVDWSLMNDDLIWIDND